MWGIRARGDDAAAREAIAATERFFRRVGVKTRLRDYGIDAAEAAREVWRRLAAQGAVFGEHRHITPAVAAKIVRARA